MRAHVRLFVEACAKELEWKPPVYEFGSRAVQGQHKDDVDLRPFFPGVEYIGADLMNGPGVDVIMDMHDTGLPSKSVGTVLCVESLEHIERPWVAVKEAHRILSRTGILIVTTVMNFYLHEPPDYWRFTAEGLKKLLSPFRNVWTDWCGSPNMPHTVVAIGFKGRMQKLDKRWNKWKE